MKREITIEEFYDMFWGENISEFIVTNEFISSNQEFIDEITYDMYRIYINSETTLNILSRITESMFKNLKVYNPNVKI